MSLDNKSNSLSGSVIELKENISINNKFKKQNDEQLEQQQKIKSIDLDEQTKLILKTVYIVLKLPKPYFKINHYIDILKGSKNAKVIKYYHNLLPAYGLFKERTRSRADVECIINKLIKDNLLIKDSKSILLIDRNLGDDLFSEKIKSIKLPILINKNQELNDDYYLTRYAYQALLNVSKEEAFICQINFTKLIELSKLQQIAHDLPTTENEFLKLANFPVNFKRNFSILKYLKVTQLYSNLKQIIESRRMNKDKNFNFILDFENDLIEYSNQTSSIDIGFNDSASNIETDGSNDSEEEEGEFFVNVKIREEKFKEINHLKKRKLSSSSIKYLKSIKK